MNAIRRALDAAPNGILSTRSPQYPRSTLFATSSCPLPLQRGNLCRPGPSPGLSFFARVDRHSPEGLQRQTAAPFRRRRLDQWLMVSSDSPRVDGPSRIMLMPTSIDTPMNAATPGTP
ncbi:hypothetical protein P3T42_000430 [Paraburkholderia sp. GAS38]